MMKITLVTETFPPEVEESDDSRMNVRFIINPSSGKGRKQHALEALIRAAAPRSDASVSLVYSERPGHTRELARRAVEEGMDRIVAAGGDGTVNEVGQELIGTRSALGIIPCGSGNGLARHLRIPSSTSAAVRLAIGGKIFAMDTGNANGLPFLNVMGVGFDAEISAQFNQLTRRGIWPYFRIGWRTLRHWKPFPFSLEPPEPDSPNAPASAWLITVANASQYGNNAVIAPGATIDDGQLDCVIIRKTSLPGLASLALRLFCRTLPGHAAVQIVRGDRFLITRDLEGWIHTDGESHWSGKAIEVKVLPKSLQVVSNQVSSSK